MKKKIIISGGGTLGHILPILPIVIELYRQYDFYFIGTRKGMEKSYFDNNDINKYFIKSYYLDMDGINRKNIFKNIKVIKKYIKIKHFLNELFKTLKPNLVIGMGGYISGVCIKQAIKLNIKTIIHEQNYVLGLANKLVYKKVNNVLLSFDNKLLKGNNIKVIGNPRYSYIKENYHKSYKNKILIFGGSLGSSYINDLIVNNYQSFKINNYTINLVVGNKYYNNNINKIEKINECKYIKIYKFINNIVEEMSQCDVVVSRAGATTLSEIMALNIPSIVIPSPNVTADHQYKNAKYYYDLGCIVLIEEKDLNYETLINEITDLVTNYKYKTKLITNMTKLNHINPKNEFIKYIKENLGEI